MAFCRGYDGFDGGVIHGPIKFLIDIESKYGAFQGMFYVFFLCLYFSSLKDIFICFIFIVHVRVWQ